MKEKITDFYFNTSNNISSALELSLDDEIHTIEDDVHHLHCRIETLHSHLGSHRNPELLERGFYIGEN